MRLMRGGKSKALCIEASELEEKIDSKYKAIRRKREAETKRLHRVFQTDITDRLLVQKTLSLYFGGDSAQTIIGEWSALSKSKDISRQSRSTINSFKNKVHSSFVIRGVKEDVNVNYSYDVLYEGMRRKTYGAL